MGFFSYKHDDHDDEFSALPSPRRFFLTILRAFTLAILIFGIGAMVSLYMLLSELAIFDKNSDQLSALLSRKQQNNTVVYDREGQPIAELFSNDHILYTFHEIPPLMVSAILSIEDRNFWQHPGFDPKGILRALVAHLSSSSQNYQQGASTITQQVVRYFLLTKEKTIIRKIKEIILAIKLERGMSKEKIFEIYANALFLGNGSYGVGAAAKRYFGKDLEQLEIHEMAVIAGLYQAPSLYNPHRNPKLAKERQSKVLYAMYKSGYLSKAEYQQWVDKPLKYVIYDPWKRKKFPYFTDYVIEEAKAILEKQSLKNQGLQIYTTIDSTLQGFADASILEANPLFERAQREAPSAQSAVSQQPTAPTIEAALLSTDPHTGEILAMTGGRNYKYSQFNRTSQSLRQAGSAFKPIVYSLALMNGRRWSDVIMVSPLTFGDGYRPRNTEDDYLSETTMLRAFYRSMNSPTMQVGEKLGISNIIKHAKRMGINSPIKQELGSILGSSEVTMLDLARLYSVFANQGRLPEISAIREIKDYEGHVLYTQPKTVPEEVIPPDVAYLMVEGMRQVLIRGTGQRASDLSPWAVGKTGTTNEAKDNWFNGFSQDVLASVWVGSDASIPLSAWSQGSHLALPIWASYMHKIFSIRNPKEFPVPEGVVRYSVHDRLGHISPQGIGMWFLKSSSPPVGSPTLERVDDEANFRDPFAK